VLDGAGYTCDFAGNRTSKTNYLNGTTWNYGYDVINRGQTGRSPFPFLRRRAAIFHTSL
jgi:hypothetical protein